jgi:deazaflavin-dependent oxidoreductase (nitroreductase family)
MGDFAVTDENKLPYLYVTTTGWKSGKPHRIEIWFVAHEGRYYIVSEGREKAHWVQNIRHHPAITVEVGERTFAGRGRALDPKAEPVLAAQVSALMDAKYEWSDGLIVELAPDSSVNS